MPSVFSQSYTTFTTAVTTVNQFSFTNTISTPIQSLTTTSSGETSLVDTSYTETAPDAFHCMTRFITFEAQQGEPITGSIIASQPTSLRAYILTEAELSKWNSASPAYCDPSDNSIQVEWTSAAERLTRVSVKWTPPADGTYYLCPQVYAGGADLITVQLTSPSVHVYTSILFSTSAATSIFATTQTLTSVQMQPVSLSETTAGPESMLLPIAAAIVVIAALAIVGLVMLRRKKQSKA